MTPAKSILPTPRQRPRRPRRRGFTLIELLVVIAIIIVLTGLGLTMLSSSRKKAQAAVSISNMREIGNYLAVYASNHGNRLPPARADIEEAPGKWGQLHWFETILMEAYPDVEPATWRNDDWFLRTKPIVYNPLISETSKPNAFAWWNPGYAINRQIVTNLDPDGIGWDWAPGKNGPQTYAIPLYSIPEPAGTPIVAPRADWHYTYSNSEIKEPGLTDFLVDEKMPILFIDGHVERMPLAEYSERKLYEMPRDD